MEEDATAFKPSEAAPGLQKRLDELPAIIAQHLGTRVTQRTVAMQVGSTSTNWHGYTRTESPRMPPASVIQGIAARYPMISLRWLLLGEGSPIQGWAAGQGEGIAATAMRLAAERGVSFSRLDVKTVSEDGVDYIEFDAAGRARA